MVCELDENKYETACVHQSHQCPLCGNDQVISYYKDIRREYLQCVVCELVFVPESYWLSALDERAEYDLHENDIGDAGYRNFLSRLATPLLEKLNPEQKGLDFGCGPGPALAMLLEESGHKVDLYDPFYYSDTSVFDKSYDFICASEVVEHLRNPKKTFATLFKMLKPGGWLAIMTKLVIDKDAFGHWHYIRDMTHICFYRRCTFKYLARQYKAAIDVVADDVILLKSACSCPSEKRLFPGDTK
jgi:SAM-dependent methyltransferase